MLWEENSEGKLYLFVPSFISNQWSSYRVSMTIATLPIGKTSLTGIESFTEINNLLQNWNCFLDALFSQMHNFLLRYIQSEARGKMKGITAHLIGSVDKTLGLSKKQLLWEVRWLDNFYKSPLFSMRSH